MPSKDPGAGPVAAGGPLSEIRAVLVHDLLAWPIARLKLARRDRRVPESAAMADSAPARDNTIHLLAILREAQDSVRGFDTKAQIVGIGYIFSIGVIGDISNFFRSGEFSGNSVLWLVITLAVLITPIVLYGLVLYPSRRMAPDRGVEGRDLLRVFYYSSLDGRDFPAYRKDVDRCDWGDELITEIVMVSNLRDLKRTRFLRALYVTGASYALWFTALFLGAIING